MAIWNDLFGGFCGWVRLQSQDSHYAEQLYHKSSFSDIIDDVSDDANGDVAQDVLCYIMSSSLIGLKFV